jgi:PAS domain-containing protein
MGNVNSKQFNEEIESSFTNVVNSPDAFVAIDYEFRFLFINRMAEKFYKKEKASIIGQKIETVFPEQWDFGPFRNARQSVSVKKYVEINYHSPFVNKWVQLIGRPFENYYTFTYRSIDHKEVLKNELRAQYSKKK